MLQAINLNKAGRNISSDEIHWRELFKTSEDSLTSTIFGLLFYLPKELFWQILLKSCYESTIPDFNCDIIKYSFWPRWDAERTSNAYHVEPDIFIETSDYDIIIEAKRFDFDQQSCEQWKSEFQAYLNEYGILNRKVYLIAVGGITNRNTDILTVDTVEFEKRNIEVVKCTWSKILRNVKEVYYQIEKGRFSSNSVSPIYNILTDLILGFRIHGFYTGEWFEETDFSQVVDIKNNSVDLIYDEILIEKIQWKQLAQYSPISLNDNHFLLQNKL